jgi:hypothetical protein
MKSIHKNITSDIKILKWIGSLYRAVEVEPSKWLLKSSWTPSKCLRITNDGRKRLIAIDIIRSGEIPKAIYHEVAKLQNAHKNLRVIVCVSEEGYASHVDLKNYAEENKLGLKIIIPSSGLKTIVTTDLDGGVPTNRKKVNNDWFPKPLLIASKKLTNLSYHQILDEFANSAEGETNIQNIMILIKKTLEKLFSSYPECCPNIASFMKLENFEKLLKITNPEANEHVIHSFKVFLSGCPVIHKFYKTFTDAHNRISITSSQRTKVEYCWLLTAIFHDIGYPKEKGRTIINNIYDGDIVTIESNPLKWSTEEYATAKKLLGSLATFISSGIDKWDVGAIPDKKSSNLGEEWANLYDKYERHSIIGAFDLLADIIKKAIAANQRANRPFMVTHAVPAALAILLHDYHIWGDAKRWKLIPINATRMPLAALLVFADSWDDYRRNGEPCKMVLQEFTIDDSGVKIVVRWLDNDSYVKEIDKYQSIKKNIKKKPFKMEIEASVGLSK